MVVYIKTLASVVHYLFCSLRRPSQDSNVHLKLQFDDSPQAAAVEDVLVAETSRVDAGWEPR